MSKWITALGLWAAVPAASFACASCFGDPNSAASKAMNLSILTLLGITLGVLGGVASFMIYLARKAAAAARAAEELALGDDAEPDVAATDLRHRRFMRIAHSARHRASHHGRFATKHSHGRGWNRTNFPD